MQRMVNNNGEDADKCCDWNQVPLVVFKREMGHKSLLINLDYVNPFLKIMVNSSSEEDHQKSEKLSNDTKTRSV